ncbi:MAG TPA: AsmA family protein, partial [Chryseosolibacter sp.]
MKLVRRIFFYSVLSLVAVVIALTASVFLYKDRIIQQFIREANKQLNTPITIKKMDVSIFQEFPQLSIVFHDVYVEDSHPGQYPLLTAKRISFQLNPIDAWRGDYTVNGMDIRDSETNLKINQDGDNNYTIVTKKQRGAAESQSALGFVLSNVSLHNTIVHYTDHRNLQDFTFSSKKLAAAIRSAGDIYDIEAKGDLTPEKMVISNNNFLHGKSFAIESHLVYDDLKKYLTIHPSELALKTSNFSVTGTYSWIEKNIIDITTTGKDTDIQTLLSLLPESKGKQFDRYRSKGDVYFKTRLNGEISSNRHPAIAVDFGFNDATLYHPDFKTRIENANLKGSFSTGDVTDLSLATLSLRDINAKLNGENFQANFVLHNFSDPEINMDFKGKIDAPAVLDLYPVDEIGYASGALVV